mmetsp:Transcript_14327/g.25522  ORF Transcript_14327/g.25522 Transcript_14327/m.25522 type:complete len:143 (+) Transcript_14327:662-1090(+)
MVLLYPEHLNPMCFGDHSQFVPAKHLCPPFLFLGLHCFPPIHVDGHERVGPVEWSFLIMIHFASAFLPLLYLHCHHPAISLIYYFSKNNPNSRSGGTKSKYNTQGRNDAVGDQIERFYTSHYIHSDESLLTLTAMGQQLTYH